jgi:Zn-dependent membrane protease YugP
MLVAMKTDRHDARTDSSMLFYDPFYVVVMLASLVIALVAQAWVSAEVRAKGNLQLRSGLSGADVARLVLAQSGLAGVRLEESRGWLTDHYDPSTRTLRLSPDTFEGSSVAAAGIAAHEAGHAIQHARRYWPMAVRQRLVPVANVGTQLGVLFIMIGLGIGALGLAKIGVLVFGGFVLFTLVTLPVEIDASQRARRALAESGALGRDELEGVSRVLRAAAGTYVAAALTAILQLLYFVSRVSGARRRRA